MKILFLGRGDNHPATRYRIIQYLDYLKQNGIEPEVKSFPKGFFAWRGLTNTKHHYDIVFIQKRRINNFWLNRFRKAGAHIVYDFDDAVMFASSRHASPDSPIRMKHFINMVKSSDAIIAGNAYLKSQAKPYHNKIWIIPTSIETTKYPLKDYNQTTKQPITLGWVGGEKSLVFIKELLPQLAELANNIQLKIVSNNSLEGTGVKIINKLWKEDEEVDDILTFDIGLAPLPDDPWSRGKCATKLLQYMAAGIPAVASPVGVHNEIIQEGVNGFLANNKQEWTDKIKILINNINLRKSVGLAGRKTVEERYSIATSAPKLVNIFREITSH